MARKKKKAARRRKSTSRRITLRTPRKIPIKVHIHFFRQCGGGYHDPTCPSEREYLCHAVKIKGIKFYVCWHKKPR
jgi:hypothetical protein